MAVLSDEGFRLCTIQNREKNRIKFRGVGDVHRVSWEGIFFSHINLLMN
jgi:hypothetical protein